MSGHKSTSAKRHLRHDSKHGYIELIPGSRLQPDHVLRPGCRSSIHSSDIIRLLAKGNPKQPDTKAHQAFALYRDGMTVAEFEKEYGKWDFLTAFDTTQPVTYMPQRTALPGIPGHGWWAKRVREIIGTHIADLGGPEALTEAERAVLRRASVLQIECERLEMRFASFPREFIARNDLELYSRLASALRRLLDLTGLGRRTPTTIVPDIDAYVRQHADDDDDVREAAE